MVFGLLIQIALIALVVFGIRTLRQQRRSAPIGHQVRNVFQYLMLVVLLFASASGLAGLLGMLVDRADFVTADSSQLALNLSLFIVGAPLLVVVGLWTKRRIAGDPSETSTSGWILFVTVGLIAPVVVTMFGAFTTIRFILRATDYDGFAFTQALVWGATWFGVDRLDRRHASQERADFRHVVLATIGLATGGVAIARLVAALIERVARSGSMNAVVVGDDNTVANAIALLAIAGPVWWWYWMRSVADDPDSDGWRLFVVLFGVAGGLITAIVSGANFLYSLAVWFLGSPSATDRGAHFESLPSIVGGVAAGLLVWWYHRTLLAARRIQQRTEIDRTYVYVMAFGGLASSAVGTIILLSALVEALTGRQLVRGDSSLNTLLLALVVLVIGLPVWWIHWRAAETHLVTGGPNERGSVSRRIYLVSLIGIGGLVALGSGVATVYLVLRDTIDGQFSTATFRSIRYAFAILLCSGVIAAFHLGHYRRDQLTRGAAESAVTRRRIVLIGPRDPHLEATLGGLEAIDLQWIPTAGGSWPHDEVLSLALTSAADLAITLTDNGVVWAELAASSPP